MSKVNPKTKSSKFSEEKLAGGFGLKAAKQENIDLLRRAVLANLLWEDVAYMDGESVSQEISRLIPLCDPQKVADLAVSARLEQKLRHTPLFMCVEMLQHNKHKKFVADILPRIITRVDMITDFVAIYSKMNGGRVKPLASAAKKGLAACFNKFTEYQFAKYDREADIRLRDVMFLVHPKPEQGKEELFKKIAGRTLTTPDTWEVALSTGKDKKETFTRLINEEKIGGLAFLRNLRNMIESNVEKKIILKGFDSLKSQMLLPINFISAAKYAPQFKREIEESMIKSYANLPKLPGRTLFIVDLSGSMNVTVSHKSEFTRKDVACIMAMLAANQCEDFELVATAGNDSTRIHASAHIKYPSKGFDLIDSLEEKDSSLGGGGIFTRQCLEWCRKNIPGEFNRIIVFSDSQDCDSVNRIPNPYGKYNYICNVSSDIKGINYKGVWTAEISGWSEHFLTYIAAYEGLENKFQEN